MNDKQEQQDFQTLIDQRLILNESPSRMHNVEIPLQFEFLKCVESQFDHDKHVFDDYFVVPKLNVSIDVSSTDPLKYDFFLILVHKC
jgi:hypothetical protein